MSRSLDTSWWSREAVPALTLAAESLREAVIRLAEHSLAGDSKVPRQRALSKLINSQTRSRAGLPERSNKPQTEI